MLYLIMLVTTNSNQGLGEAYGATQGGGTCGAQLIPLVNEYDYTKEGKLEDLSEKEEEEVVNDGMGEVEDSIQEQQGSNCASFDQSYDNNLQ